MASMLMPRLIAWVARVCRIGVLLCLVENLLRVPVSMVAGEDRRVHVASADSVVTQVKRGSIDRVMRVVPRRWVGTTGRDSAARKDSVEAGLEKLHRPTGYLDVSKETLGGRRAVVRGT
jgi:hypothetical protein